MKKLILFSLLLSVKVYAADHRACTELSRFTCSVGSQDDGTGKAFNPSHINNPINQIAVQLKDSALKKFRTALSDSQNKQFRKQTLAATNLSLAPQCEGAVDKLSEACLEILAEGATEVAMNRLINPKKKRQTVTLSDENEDYFAESTPFKNIQKQLFQEIREKTNISSIKNKVKDEIFPEVKKQLIAKVNSFAMDETIKQNLMDKIEAIEFKGMDCSEVEGESISAMLTPNALYTPHDNAFRVCSAMPMLNQSEFALAFTIAHELSHSIDPCNIARGPSDYTFKYKLNESDKNQNPKMGGYTGMPYSSNYNMQMPNTQLQQANIEKEYESQNPFKGLIQCLRDKKSIEAQSAPTYVKALISQSRGKSEPFCGGDQIGEAFSDWFAVEALPKVIAARHPNLTQEQYRIGFSNVFRWGTCNDENAAEGALVVHPKTRNRIDKIILVQPEVRKRMGCQKPAEARYCNGEEFVEEPAEVENAEDANMPYYPNSEPKMKKKSPSKPKEEGATK